MKLLGKRIIVTGGALGIGASVVNAYAAAGGQVAALDIADDPGKKVVDEAAGKGPGPVRYYHCDVSERASVEDAFAAAVRDLGGLDVLAHVAGIGRYAPAEEISDDDLDQIININVYGVVYTNQAAFRFMRETGGRIINFGSVAGLVPFINGAHYSASKGAVFSWTRTIAHEWGKYGIIANAMSPAIRTSGYEVHRTRMNAEQLEALDTELARLIPLGGQLGDPDRDFAPVMVFMASEDSRFITGQIIPVDGGRLTTR